MGEDLSPAGAVLQWPLRHDILLLPVGAPWILQVGGAFLRLLAILSYSLSLSTSTFAMMTFQTFNWVHLQIRCPSLIRFDLLQTFF